jgi:hypothetical protein
LAQVRGLLGAAGSAADERDHLSQAVGWLLGWAGQQTPIAADRGGNVRRRWRLWADGLHRPLDHHDAPAAAARESGLAAFHRVLEPVRRIRYLFAVHFSAQIEEFAPVPKERQPLAAGPGGALSSTAGFVTTVSRRWSCRWPTGSTAKARKRPRGWSWSPRGLAMVRQSNVSRGRK